MNTILSIIFLSISVIAQCQPITHPILSQNPKHGIFYSIEDFLDNNPDEIEFEKSFEIIHQNTEDQDTLFYLKKKNKRILNYWGYSNENGMFIMKNKQFHKIEIKNNEVFVFGSLLASKKNLPNSKLEIAAMKRRKTKLKLNLKNGELTILDKKNQYPILFEQPKKGIYKHFYEFKYNVPHLPIGFNVQSQKRIQQNWENTVSHYPTITRIGKHEKKATDLINTSVWGFSDGNNIYVYHQIDFFPIEITKNNQLFFTGYKKMISNATNNILFGINPITLIVNSIKVNNASKKKEHYKINGLNGRVSNNATTNNLLNDVELILYRRKTGESKSIASININNQIVNLNRNQIDTIHIPLGLNYLEIETKGQTKKIDLVLPNSYYFQVKKTKRKKATLTEFRKQEAEISIKYLLKELEKDGKRKLRNKKKI